MTGQLKFEIEEVKRFIGFLERTKRVENIEYIDRYRQPRTPKCIHVIKDFIIAATNDHNEKTIHLKKLDKTYKPYREHALDCKRCQASLDTIFTFTGYEHRNLFIGTDSNKILQAEWDSLSENDLSLCKILPPNYNKVSELTYITSLSLSKALDQFYNTIQKPLNLKNFSDPVFRTKTSSKGLGISYAQTYLVPKDNKGGSKICIRSRVR